MILISAKNTIVVLVHGIAGSGKAHFSKLLLRFSSNTTGLEGMDFDTFEYDAGRISIISRFIPGREQPGAAGLIESLVSYVREISSNYEQIILIGYSAGGILVRGALQSLSSGSLVSKVSGVVYIATPEVGSDIAGGAKALGVASRLTEDLAPGSAFMREHQEKYASSEIKRIPCLRFFGLQDGVINAPMKMEADDSTFLIANVNHSTILDFPNGSPQLERLLSFLTNPDTKYKLSQFGESRLLQFSPSIIESLNKFNRKVENLTSQQFDVLERLSLTRAASISGGAGTGKTLLAVEKAIRLAAANFRVGLFCHSPILARNIRSLLQRESRVSVFYFHDFVVRGVNGLNSDTSASWSEFDEPSEDEIYAACARLSEPGAPEFDAVIVDEAQEFREDWLDLLRCTIPNGGNGLFYLFFDEMQRTNRRMNMPELFGEHLELSTNCRNSGAVFDCVKALYPRESRIHPDLAESGVVNCMPISDGDFQFALQEAISDAVERVGSDRVVVLTTESVELDDSILANMRVYRQRKARWQEGLLDLMRRTREGLARSHSDQSDGPEVQTILDLPLPELGKLPYPTEDDVKLVSAFAQVLRSRCNFGGPFVRFNVVWQSLGNKLVPMKINSRLLKEGNEVGLRSQRSTSKLDTADALGFLLSDWRQSLSAPRIDEVIPYYRCLGDGIPLFHVNHFKGCEADAVVLFVRSPIDSFDRVVYVGLSRAKFCLNLVASRESLSRLPALPVSDRTNA